MKFLWNCKTLKVATEELANLGGLEIPGEKGNGAFSKLGMKFPNNHRSADPGNFEEQRFEPLRLNIFTARDNQTIEATL